MFTIDAHIATLERSGTLTAQVTNRLEHLITERHLQPGDRLPSERDLADQFGVSRTVVREAVRALVARSLLEVKPGSGTLIRAPSQQSVTKTVSSYLKLGQPQPDYGQVHEVRRVLEVEIAGLASERRTAQDLVRLQALLDEMPTLEGDHSTFAENDVAFHAALAEATHNDLFSILLGSIADILFKVRELGNRLPGAPDHALAYHQRIFEEVRAGNPEGARQTMLAHLIDSEVIFGQALTTLERKGLDE